MRVPINPVKIMAVALIKEKNGMNKDMNVSVPHHFEVRLFINNIILLKYENKVNS